MRKDDEVVPASATNQNQKCFATEAVLPVGELASGGSENGYAASVAPISGRRKVFWCDREASQPESLWAGGSVIKLSCQGWSGPLKCAGQSKFQGGQEYNRHQD
jgi:hypothetical protein